MAALIVGVAFGGSSARANGIEATPHVLFGTTDGVLGYTNIDGSNMNVLVTPGGAEARRAVICVPPRSLFEDYQAPRTKERP